MPTNTNIDFEFVINSISEGVFTVDKQFNITTFNAAAENITGFKRSVVIGKKCYEILKGSHCNSESCLVHMAVNNW